MNYSDAWHREVHRVTQKLCAIKINWQLGLFRNWPDVHVNSFNRFCICMLELSNCTYLNKRNNRISSSESMSIKRITQVLLEVIINMLFGTISSHCKLPLFSCVIIYMRHTCVCWFCDVVDWFLC